MSNPTTQPNVWFVMADQHRWDALGCYGNSVIETTNLDYIASRGTRFTNAYTCSPSCVPTRASLITGQNVWHTGIMYRDPAKGSVPVYDKTLPACLAEAGYHTQCVGGLGVGPPRTLQGFHDVRLYSLKSELDSDYQHWFRQQRPGEVGSTDHGLGPNDWAGRPWHLDEYLHPSAWVGSESIRFLQRRDPYRPFFLKTSFLRPHAPYDPPGWLLDLYRQRELPDPVIGDWASIHDVDATNLPDAWHGRLRPEQQRAAKAAYYASIHFVDIQIGRIYQYLRRHQLLDNTIIVYTSDHGDMMGDHYLRRKSYAYEGSSHVPLLLALPGSMKGEGQSQRAQVDAPACHMDIMPTILDACGVDIPDSVDGKSLMPAALGRKAPWREYLHGEHRACFVAENEHHFLTDGTWKYIWFTQTDQEQLFHLESDPYEVKNLADQPDHAAILKQWRQRLVETLAPRNAGLVRDGRLVCQAGKPAPISPHFKGFDPA